VIDVRNDGDVANVLIKTFSFVGQAHRLPKQVTATGAVALQQIREREISPRPRENQQLLGAG